MMTLTPPPSLRDRIRTWARSMKTEVHAVYLAGRDPRTPWAAKVIILIVAAYALSPIDLIPDFIPVLGYLDDLILVPAGLALAVRMVPSEVMADCRARARGAQDRPRSTAAAVAIVIVWVLSISLVALGVWRRMGR